MKLRSALHWIGRPSISFVRGLHGKACDCIRFEGDLRFCRRIIAYDCSPLPCYDVDARSVLGATRFGRILVSRADGNANTTKHAKRWSNAAPAPDNRVRMRDPDVNTVTSVEMLLTEVRNNYREWGTSTFPWFRGEPLTTKTPPAPSPL